MCQANSTASGDAVSPAALQSDAEAAARAVMGDDWYEDDKGMAYKLEAALSSLLAENARLREALKPFAKAGELFTKSSVDSMTIYAPSAGEEYWLESEDLYRARVALGIRTTSD